jgi:hypothetical protein
LRSLRIQINILNRHVPVRVKDFEAMLLFALVGILVGKKLLEERRGIKRVVSDLGVLEDDGGAIVPAAVFGAVVARRGREYFQYPPQFHFFLKQWIVIFLEQRDEFFRMPHFAL